MQFVKNQNPCKNRFIDLIGKRSDAKRKTLWKGVHLIYVNQKQLDQVEYLLEQSSRGHHVLFENTVIRQVFERVGNQEVFDLSSPETADASEGEPTVEKHIENLILQPTILSKRHYLDNLSPETFDRVVFTYFSIVENNIYQALEFPI